MKQEIKLLEFKISIKWESLFAFYRKNNKISNVKLKNIQK